MTSEEKRFEENLQRYTGVSEQGVAIWIPKEVKKKLEIIRANSDRNIPVRSLAATIIMTNIEENEKMIDELLIRKSNKKIHELLWKIWILSHVLKQLAIF